MSRLIAGFTVGLVVIGLGGVVHAVPGHINHEGLLLEDDHTPFAGAAELRFSIYDGPFDGEALWSEDHDVLILDGYYNLMLGSEIPFDGALDGDNLHLGISIDGGPEMEPRQPLGSVAFALIADNVVGDITPRSISVGGRTVVDDEGMLHGVVEALREADGSGSGVDSDRLDGLDSTVFMRADGDTGTVGSLTVLGSLFVEGDVSYGGNVHIAAGYSLGVGVDEPVAAVDVAGDVRAYNLIATSLILTPLDEAPDDPVPGQIYLDAESGGLRQYDGEAWNGVSGTGQADTIEPSCLDLQVKNPGTNNGIYRIDPDGQGGREPFDAYCDMATEGGGWTLAMKSNANNGDFHYDSGHWTDTSTMNTDDFDLANGVNAKYEVFNRLRVSELLIVGQNGKASKFTLTGAKRGRTLLQLTSEPYDQNGFNETQGGIHGRYYENSYLFPDVRINGHEHYICHPLAFNSNHYNGGCHNRARIGYSMSQEYSCGHPGSAEGLGMKDFCHNDNLNSGRLQWSGETNFFRRAAVYVRGERPPPPPPEPTDHRSCLEIQLADDTAPNGVHAIDPDGRGGRPPFNVYCDMSTDGGGWTLAMKSLSDNDDFYYDSAHWTGSSILRADDFGIANGVNAKYESFNRSPVKDLMIVAQNGQVRRFTLQAGKKGRTLLQLTSEGYDQNGANETSENIHGSFLNNSYLFPDVRINGHEHYICHPLAFNSNHYNGGCHNRARIGYSMSQEFPCQHPGTAEGLGMKDFCHDDNLNSGRLQWGGEENFFRTALVYVREEPPPPPPPDATDDRSCKAIKERDPEARNGVHAIDPDGRGGRDPFRVYCEMAAQGGGWTLALKSNSDNGELHYDSDVWTSAGILNATDLDVGSQLNAKYESFNRIPVERLLIVAQNGQERLFTLTDATRGRTLFQLTSAGYDQNGFRETREAIHGGFLNNSYLFPDIGINGHEHYICHPLAFNSNHYNGGCHNIARIGYSMSQEYGCGHPGTSEGLGMKDFCHDDNLNSGRLQWGGEQNFFRKALVYVQ